MYDDEAKYSIYYIDVPIDVYNNLKSNIPKFKNTLFNYIGAILNNVIGTNFTFNDRLFCSEFVSTALSQVIPDFSETPWDDDPMDLKELCDTKLEYVTTITMKHGE